MADPFGSIGAGVSDIFAGFADETKAKGDILEGQAYGEAATLAFQNEQFTKMSTDIQEAQAQRELLLSQGRTQAEVAGAGFAASGSALDILRSSAAQGSLQKAVVEQQGLITAAGFEEQGQSYLLMQQAANNAASAEKTAAIGSFIAGGIDILSGLMPPTGAGGSGVLPGGAPLGQGGIGSA
jgi:hypothetical protein